jgi:glycosyltransferase involved in cell wall biosynthesis
LNQSSSGEEIAVPVLLVSTRYAVAGSIRTHADGIRIALETVGVPTEEAHPEWFGKWPVGGAVLPTARMLLRHQPAGRFVHAIDVESCYRGTAVVTVHDPLIGWEEGPRVLEFPYRWQMSVGVHRARRIVGVGSSTADRIRSMFPDVAERVRWIPPAFDTRVTEGRPKVRDVIWIGRNDPVKGLPTFLDALRDPALSQLKTLVKWTPQRKWPELADLVRAMLRELPHVESVPHPVEYAALQEWVSGSRCLVSTSTSEGTHAVPMEAYVRRTRIVLPKIPAYTDVFRGSAPGVHWYESRDRDDLIRAILSAVNAPTQFDPDRETLERVSYATVGTALKRLYIEAGWDGQ